MQVKLIEPKLQDQYYLINATEFMRIVDQQDLAQRKSDEIINSYHEYWLSKSNNGIYLFHPPEFYLTKGLARFINGRHRMLVLHKYLTEIPMALTNMDGCPVFADKPHQMSVEVLNSISVTKLNGNEVFNFPDLPIKYLGYDHNIGK